MAFDQKIKNVAEKLICIAEYLADVISGCIDSPRRSESNEITDSDCTQQMSQLVNCRLILFHVKLKELKDDLELFKNNDIDFVRYIQENMSKYFAYPHMNIFDKIFMSCAVVATMSSLLYLNGMSRKNATLCWLMYFEEEFKEEFYAVEDCWEEMKKYAKMSCTYLINTFGDLSESEEQFETYLEFAEYARKDSLETHKYTDIMETFKQRIYRPLGSFCCLKCLPLYDVLYMLTFETKLFDDFQLVEGYMQLFVRKAMQNIADSAAKIFHKRMFKNEDFKTSEDEHGGYVCMFCGVKEKKSIDYLKSIICRTTVCENANAERVLDRNEERRALIPFLKFG